MSDRLREIISTMEIPHMRNDIGQNQNLLWIQRNLEIRNGSHPDVEEALLIVRNILLETKEK